MGRGGATGARRWWTAVVLGALVILAADTASAASGQQTVSFTIVETRGVAVVAAGPDGAREISWSGPGLRMTVEVTAASEGELEGSSGRSSFLVSPGDRIALDPAATSFAYLLTGPAEVTFRLAAA